MRGESCENKISLLYEVINTEVTTGYHEKMQKSLAIFSKP